MIWNFIANILYCFGNIIPALPAECLKFVDMSGGLAFLDPEFGGHLFTKLLFLMVIQCGVAIVLSFQFRYLVICHSQWIKTVHPTWGYIYCIAVHLTFSVFQMCIFHVFEVSREDYPNPEEINGKERLSCYHPYGARKILCIVGLFGMFVVLTITCLVLIYLSFLHLKRNEKSLQTKTVNMQKKVLSNLVKLAVVPVLMGALPILIGSYAVFYPHSNGSNEIFCVCMLVMLNHGAVYGIVTFCVFPEYKEVVKRFLIQLLSKICYCVVNGTPTTVYVIMVK
ncbi:hypothetical protein L596_020621 [Steinernema carpocapsae]|uniref:G-protein coupled receptors family 1 profile domain-containing protein n=1 Tax=Steinernema carpocapsae TaxID=34508 RepID=A0A4V6A0Y4_STECR|nr:hypothetical protein L596_020621 [Steinernema carpocapsae]